MKLLKVADSGKQRQTVFPPPQKTRREFKSMHLIFKILNNVKCFLKLYTASSSYSIT